MSLVNSTTDVLSSTGVLSDRCASMPSVALSDFVFAFSVLLAVLWGLVALALMTLGVQLRPSWRFALMSVFAGLYCACKCAHFASDSAFVLPTPGLQFDTVSRLLGNVQLLFFVSVARGMLVSATHDVVLRRVAAMLLVVAVAQLALVGVTAGFFADFADPRNPGLIAVLFLSDLCDVLVSSLSLFAALRSAQAARAGLVSAQAQSHIKWHHRFTLFGALFTVSRLFAAFVSIVLFALLVADGERSPLRINIELGAIFTFFIEIVPMVFLTQVFSGAPVADDERPRGGLAGSKRFMALRRAFTPNRLVIFFVCLLALLLAIWGMHSSCFLDAAPLGGGLAAARAGAVPLYALIPLSFVPVLYGFVSFLEAASFGTFFPRDAGDSISLHKWLAGLIIVCAVIHMCGHFSTLHAYAVFPDKAALTPALNVYFSDIENQRRGIWMLPWISGFVLVGLFVLLVLSFVCCRQRGNAALFMIVHRVCAYGALVLVAVHGAGVILKPFPYMWIGCVFAVVVLAVDHVVKRTQRRDVEVELRLVVTLNQESHAVERVVIAQLRDELKGVVPGAYAGVAFPSLHSDDVHPFTVVYRAHGLHAFHIACTPRWRSWTNELARVAQSTPRPLLPRMRALVCAAFRSEISDPSFLRAANVVMVALGTGATPFIGVADAVAATRHERRRAQLRIRAADDAAELRQLNPDEIGMESVESSDIYASDEDKENSDDDDGGPRLSFCHRSERHVVIGRVTQVDETSVLVDLSSDVDWAALFEDGLSRARVPVEVRLQSRVVCQLTSSAVGHTHDGRVQLFDVTLTESLRASVPLELADAATGRTLLKDVKPTATYRAGRDVDLITASKFADWQKLNVQAGVRLVLRTPSRAVAEVASDSVQPDSGSVVRVRLDTAVAALGMLLTVGLRDPVRVRQTRTVRTAVASLSGGGTMLVTQLPWADWSRVVAGSDATTVDVVLADAVLLSGRAAATICRQGNGVLELQLDAAPAAAPAAGAAVELRLARESSARVGRRFEARSLIIDSMAPDVGPLLLDAAWSSDLIVANDRVGAAVARIEALPARPTALKVHFQPQVPQPSRLVSVGDTLALHTLGAYAQVVSSLASRLPDGLSTHIDRKAFWRVIEQRIFAAAASERRGGVHVGFCGARMALAQLRSIIDATRERTGSRIEMFAEVFG
jgi:hypothetical protein